MYLCVDIVCRWLRALFDESDENGDGDLSLKEIVNMMKRLNVGISTKIIRKMFKVREGGRGSTRKGRCMYIACTT